MRHLAPARKKRRALERFFGLRLTSLPNLKGDLTGGDGKFEKTKYTTANYKQLEQQAKDKKVSPGSGTEKQKYTTANYKQLEANAKQEKQKEAEEKQKKSPSGEKAKTEKLKYTTANYKQLDALAKEKKLQHSAIVETNEKIMKNLEKTGNSLMKSIEKTSSMLLMRKSKSSTAFGSTADIKEDEQNLPTLV